MNKYVYDTYTKLNETERAEFTGKFRNSPTVIRFIEFLGSSSNPNFKTRAAIEAVYGDEKEKEYSILENRFFKLRKKIKDELEQTKRSENLYVHTEEEQKLLFIKQLLASGNKETAHKELTELEKVCWERNIFELLPSVIDQLIFCNQSFNRLNENKPLFIRLEKAIELLHDINVCGMTTRKIYEINFTKGIKNAVSELKSLRKFASKHKEYPRFLLCYHHVSAYYKLGSKDYIGHTSEISRHLNAFKKLQSIHPMIPLMMYKVNYVQQQHMHFNQMTMSYHFGKCEFEETYQVMKEVWDVIMKENSILKMYKTESSYYNMITAQCMTQRYQEALETINDFILYLKANHQTDKLVLANVLKARVYSDVYPQAYKIDPEFLLEQVEDYLKILKKEDNMMISLDQTLVLKAKLQIFKNQYKKAKAVIAEPVAKNYLLALNLFEPFMELINILSENSGRNNRKLSEFNKTVQLLKHKANTPAEYMHIYWLQHYITYLLR